MEAACCEETRQDMAPAIAALRSHLQQAFQTVQPQQDIRDDLLFDCFK